MRWLLLPNFAPRWAVMVMPEHDSDTYRAALAALDRVRELHKPSTEAGWEDAPYCESCAAYDHEHSSGLMRHPWPCPTIKALDGT